MIKRFLDLAISAIAIVIFFVPIIIISVMVKITSKGPIIYWSDRVGQNNNIYSMPKFRTMKVDTPVVATHLLSNGQSHLTKIGNVLRKTSLDELPQLFSVLFGKMSIVGPRPALYNQYDLIKLRTENNVHKLKPGITGWAQINGRDEISIAKKVTLDSEYTENYSTLLDMKIIFLTIQKVIIRKDISH